jgi:hypothetical protein
MPKPIRRLSLEKARHVWISAQGLPPTGTPLSPTLERTGFVRTLGGVDVYLAARARVAGLRAADLDGAVARSEAQVIPAVRGCIYLVARRHVATALRFAESLSGPRVAKEHVKAGIKKGEVEKVAQAVLKVLAKQGPLTTDAIRKALPEGTVRSLGEKGKKVGLSSPLPPALRSLEFAGKVERTLQEGRLDTERYLWRVPKRAPAAEGKPAGDLKRLAEVFLRAAGLGSPRVFAEWAGVAKRDAQAAIDALDTEPVAIDGVEEVRYALADAELDDVDAAAEAVAFLPFADNLVELQGGPQLLVEPAYHGIPVPSWGSSKPATLGSARYLMARAILVEGRLRGLWEYDPDERRIVHHLFEPVASAARARVEREAAGVAELLARDLGHGRSFSLDTDEALRDRARHIERGGSLPVRA